MDARDYLFMSDLFPEIPRPRVGPSPNVRSIPVSTAAPVISGTTDIGDVLSCTTGSWAFNPTEYIYHWRRDGKGIAGASASTYTLVSPDVGKDITCAVVAVNEHGQSDAAVSNTISIPLPDTPVNTVAPVISGTATVGNTLSCTTGTWDNDPDSYAYLWKRNGVSQVSGSTYLLGVADAGTNITCEVTATNANGDSTPAVSNTLAIASIVPGNTVAPVISGTTAVGQTLSCTTGTWTNSPTSYGYQWRRDGVNIGSATSSTYLLVSLDGGTDVTCRVTAANAGGSASATSNTLAIDAEGATLATPTLDLQAASDTGSSSTDNITSDTTPTLTVTFPDGLLENDHIIVRDNLVEVDDHTVTAGEAGGTPIDLGLAALSDGSHSITIRQERGAEVSDWSSALVLTIDAVGPAMTSAATANCAENATLSFALTASEASSFAITGGVDAAQFSISGSTLRWVANGTQDYETPLDSGANNTYVCAVTPTATLSGAVGTPQSITITVTDISDVSSPPAIVSSGISGPWGADQTVTLPSASAGDLIVVITNGYSLAFNPTHTSSNLTFTQAYFTGFEGDVAWAVAAGTLTNEVITIGGGTLPSNMIALAISGANTSSPFDGILTVNPAAPLAITTTVPNTLVIGTTGQDATGASGWTSVITLGYMSAVSKEAATAGSYTPTFSATGDPNLTLAVKPA